MYDVQEFQRLACTADVIARHPDYPGKQVVVQECLMDIEERCRQGRLTWQQRTKLLDILMCSVGPEVSCGR